LVGDTHTSPTVVAGVTGLNGDACISHSIDSDFGIPGTLYPMNKKVSGLIIGYRRVFTFIKAFIRIVYMTG
jgi:hypothetical protein